MKGFLNNILVLFCASLFHHVLAAPLESTTTNKYVNYSIASPYTEADLADIFHSEDSDGCTKANIALYKIQQYFNDGQIDEACTPINDYSKFLESFYVCKNGELNIFYITPALGQRKFLCTKDSKGEYCDPNAIISHTVREREQVGLDIRNKYCKTSNICKKAYIDFKNTLFKLQDIDVKMPLTTNIYDKSNSKPILNISTSGICKYMARLIDQSCAVSDEETTTKINKTTTTTKVKTSTTTKTSKSTVGVSENGKCGPKEGTCPDGECCSQYGWCGTSSSHCKISNGCQSEFGKCNGNASTSVTTSPSTTTKTSKPTVGISKNGKCGPKEGTCPSGECCSKYGYCGTSDKHCSISEGCQSEFGKCNGKSTVGVSKNGKCGQKEGTCPSGECCSKYGYCGTSSKHCAISQGCQSEFGICNGKGFTSVTASPSTTKKSTPTNKDGQCGPKYGNCSSGNCCSKHGWCGKTSLHCDVANGCQSEFGHCN